MVQIARDFGISESCLARWLKGRRPWAGSGPSTRCRPCSTRPTGSRRVILTITSCTDGDVMEQLTSGLRSRLHPASVTDTANTFLPTSIATATVEGVTRAA